MKLAEFDLGTIVYIIFLALYGIYTMYKKSLKNAEKKYQQPTDSFPTSLPKQPQKSQPKPQQQAPAKDIWKELMGEEVLTEQPQERHFPDEKKQRTAEVKQKAVTVRKKEVVVKPKTPSYVRPEHRETIKASISEHASFLPGDFAITETNNLPEEGVSVMKGRIRQIGVDANANDSLPDDFDPRTAFKYAVLLEKKYA
jgi:hypothetical protein